MTLGDKRRRFTQMLGLLVQYAHLRGYEVCFDFVKRCEECPVGHKTSLHKIGLAADVNLYKDGRYLETTDDHEPLGLFWEYLGGTWGGRFNDGNHYSLEHGGMK
jgi:hypothetical protein